jgi:Zn finger protein HypA/HybF involved in hydrogenase expression
MARKSRYNITVESLSTQCTKCQYLISPNEQLRTGAETMRCPKCGENFVPEAKGKWSQLGN